MAMNDSRFFDKNPAIAVAWDEALEKNSNLRGVLGTWNQDRGFTRRHAIWELDSQSGTHHYEVETYVRDDGTARGELYRVSVGWDEKIMSFFHSDAFESIPMFELISDEALSQEWLLWNGLIRLRSL